MMSPAPFKENASNNNGKKNHNLLVSSDHDYFGLPVPNKPQGSLAHHYTKTGCNTFAS